MSDVFGTVVDRRTSIEGEFERVCALSGPRADWPGLTTQWRSLYPPTLLRVAFGAVPWRSLDEPHRMMRGRVRAPSMA
ncbi:hypothetical protein [Streptomyces europaeiscabiei]|uniref:hypothetical protein n=1 Tax=Streptomyces europaeiscabiei TaxID=146819 RepID=UPI0029B8AF7D|nr:hypothetical protein [Streptomyces europaeiscabiei]MDX3715380.1 hypothetical protein [Streptomyces europaeiscabiei]MDX3866205.1 hypothetical protein [Streptomyces europaeiscabiei]